ncbi:MAG TPA: phosphopantetheine-binding protein, partial [Bryobacteraceae bacterium]|nr:phosphopantetheine-binding protein [Bryobacteraceae bacterium]
MRVRVAATGGEVTECDVAASSGFSEHSAHDHGFAVFGAESMDQLMAQLASRHSSWSDESSFRVAIVARDAGTLAARRELAMRLLTDDPQVASGPLCDGVWFGRGTLQGEIACVFGGPAGAYAGMGRELLLAFPGLAESLCERAASFRESAAWLYESEPAMGASPEEKLWGSSFLIQAHAELMLRRLDLRPHAAIGYCSGETNALFAFGAWTDLDDFHRELKGSGFYSTTLSGEFQCLRSAWGLEAHETAAFTTLRVAASAERIREALASEPRVHLAIVHSANDAVIAGDPEGCRRVADRVGAARASSLGYDFVMHCPEAKIVADEWRALHRRTTQPVPGVRFYTHATLSSYTLSDDSVADALVGQAMRTIDFPAMIERAWADGVRIFIEHGPHAACTRWIDEILGDRPHLAVALDQPGRSSVLQALESVARLFAAGVPLDPRVLVTDNAEKSPKKAARHEMQISAHAEPVRLAEFPVQIMTPPPRIPSVLPPISFERNSGMGEHCAAPTANDVDALALHHHDLAQLHIAFQRQLAASHMQFVELLSRITVDSAPDLPSEIVPVFAPAPAHRENLLNAGKPGPKLDRRALEAIASGPIAPVLGPLFEEQDGFRRVVRMPEPPLLLVDRVTGIKGTPYSMGQGTIWTETDIAADGWYLHEGRMPAGLVVEAGQADLLLISWLGIDQFNRGERVYRLLGCDLTLFGELPGPGETLAYEITINGHAQQGNVRLFFFQYDCRVNGELRMKVRGGQAGFFTDQELAETGGVLFDPETGPPTANGRVDPAPVTCLKSALSAADIQAFIEGRAHECFGEGFHFTQSHTRTPSIQGGNLRLIDEVLEFDPAGGPWKRGYLRAKLALSAEHWFYKGHFKDDPCMPGTLMLEGSLQAMSIYLAALGFTLDRDGFLFMPAAGNEYKLRCRGQATPRSRELIYEVFVDELIGGTEPILFADLLGTVDGVKAFHCRRMGLKLTAAYPLDRGRIAPPVARSLPADSGAPFVFDLYSLLACAWGRPSEAFGPMYAVYDSGKVVPRLPGPPFHFMSRIVSTEGRMGGGQTGTKVEVEYDIPEDAWYFADNHLEEMPLCALMEVALQPCGWIASFSGVLSGEEFCFRNLDGDGVVHRSVGRRAGVLSTTVHFTSHSRVGNMIIVGFEVEVRSAEGPVFSCETRFGYFTRESMREQAGLPAAEQNEPAPAPWALDAQPTPRVTGKLRMIDEVVSLWPDGGAAKLGRIVARRNVLPDDWYFRAHFYRDPVQPGSLGVEAMLQALQILCEERSRVDGRSVSRIEPLGDRDTRIVWKYRGQVTPNNRDVTVDVIITDIESTADGAIIRAEGSLYVDSKRIYHASGLSARVVTASNELRAARLFALSGDTEYDILAERDRMEARVKAGASLANISTESLDRAGGDFAVACSLIADDRAALMRELGWAAVGIPKAVSTGSPWITPSGSYFAPVPLGSSGKIAFIYPGMGSAMAGAGAKIFRRFTDPVCKLRAATGQADGELCDTVSGPDSAVEPLARDAMKVSRASMVLSYLYTQLLRDEYGVSPQMAAGFSVGEGSMFAALSVWPNPALLDRKFADSKLFTERLAGPMISAREHFGIDAGKDFFWRSAIVQGPLDRIRTALSSEPTVSLITIHTPREAMIGGEATACGRVLDALQLPYIDAPFQLAIHCGAARREVKTLRWIHELPVKPHPGVEFYSAVFDQPIDQTSSAIASALAESYTQTVDFPKLIGRLYEDGARIFVEAGGQSNCSHWIGRILQGRPHACAALHSSVLDEEEALLRGLGVLLSHRVKLTLSASNAQFAIKPEAGSSHPDGQDGGVSGGRWQALILRQVADLLGINEPSQIPLDSPIPLDSLSYMQLRSRLEGASGCLIEPDLLRENRTVRRLAAAIEDLTDKTASRREEFQPSQRHAGSWGQLSMWRMPRAISSQLTPLELHRSVPILWVRSRIEFEGPLEVERLSTAILDTFARYDILRSV